MPLDFCGAESQGMIGYMLQQCLINELRPHRAERPMMTVLTQTLVDRDDPAFGRRPSPSAHSTTARRPPDSGRRKAGPGGGITGQGFRRLVPSPRPLSILEGRSVKDLFDKGMW